MVIRSWKEAVPVVGHETAIIWSIFRGKGSEGLTEEEAPLLGTTGFTLHKMQPGVEGDYHDHEDREQIYYFTEGRGTRARRGTQFICHPSASTSSSTTQMRGSST